MQGRLPEQRAEMAERDTQVRRRRDDAGAGSAARAPLAGREGAVFPAHPHAPPQVGAARALPAPPARPRRAGGADRPRRAGVADDALPQAARQAGAGLAPGQLLHPDPPRYALRRLDRHRRLRRAERRDVVRDRQPARAGLPARRAATATATAARRHHLRRGRQQPRRRARTTWRGSPTATRNCWSPAKAGDVVFFAGHVLHRSKKNFTTDRFRRSFVSHYCNARSFTQWGADAERATSTRPRSIRSRR